MHDKILDILKRVTSPFGIPAPVDLRQELARNPGGYQWRDRDVNSLEGVVWHQALANGPIEAIAHYHTGVDSHLCEGGVESIAYTFAIRKDGQVVLCNDLTKKTWSQGYKGTPGDENAKYISVLFEGFLKGEGISDSDAGEPTTEQILSGISLWKVLKALFKWSDDALKGHYDFGKPACPGNTLKAIIEANSFGKNANKPDIDTVHQEEAEAVVNPVQEDLNDSTDDEFIESESEKIFSLNAIEERQQALQVLGYYRGAIDGIWGPQSSAAFTFFQNSAGIQVDGIWGPQSEAAINKALNEFL